MTDFVNDLDIVDQSTVELPAQLYAAAQWMNGDPKMAAAGGVAHTGGVVLPTKYADDNTQAAPGWSLTTVAFSTGKSESVFAAPKPRLAVIRTRFRWFSTHDGRKTFYPRAAYRENSGMRGHIQALCFAHGFDFPFTVTFTGTASREFEKLLKEFTQKVGDAALKAAREKNPQAGRFPRFAFYLRLAPGPHQKVGQKGQESIVTPPTLELPSVIGAEYLGKIYVGREKLTEYQQIYLDSAEWAAAWDRPGAEESEAPDAPPPADAETGEVVDVLTQAEANGAMKAAGVKESAFREALKAANGSFDYVPSRDTAIVRRLVNAALAAF